MHDGLKVFLLLFFARYLLFFVPLVESIQMVPCLPSNSHGNPRLHVPD
jgi:hypothetical protein